MNPIAKSLRSLERKQIWGWPFFWFALPIYFLLSLAFDVFLENSWRIEWLTIAVVTYLSAALLAYLLNTVFIDNIFANRGTWIANVIIIGLVGAFKNSLVGLMSLNFGLTDYVEWPFRIFGGASLAFGVLLGFVYLLGARIDNHAVLEEIAETRTRLIALRMQAKPVLEAERNLLIQQTQKVILPRLDQIQQSLFEKSEAVGIVDDLRELVTQEVRPLAASLRQAADNLAVISVPPVNFRKSYRFLNERVESRLLIRPAAMSLYLIAGHWVITYIVLNEIAANWGFLFSLVALGVIAIIKALIPAGFRVPPARGLAWLVALGFVSANISYWPLKEFSLNFQQDILLLLVAMVDVTCVVGFAFTKSVELDLSEALVQFKQENESLAREAALFDQQMWIARRNWSFVVHGTVQASLTAAITRLSSTVELEQYQIDLALQDLERAKEALSTTPTSEIDLDKTISNLTSTWAGICDIKFDSSERAKRTVSKDANARLCVNEICKEAVSNAVRHGEAKNIKISIDRSEDKLLVIEVSDNGRGLPSKVIPGVGSRMLDDLSVDWSIASQSAQGRTVLTARLPISGFVAEQI